MSKEENLECSFCGRKKAETDLLIAGIDAHICDKCIEQAHGIVEEEVSDTKTSSLSKDLTLKKPKEIKEFLDQYIIGQTETKRAMSVAVYNHYKRLLQTKNDDDDDVEIEKSNIVLVGETGTGKTLVAKTIARMLNIPFAIVDATVLTQAGYVGEDVESILSKLLQAADYDVEKAQRGIIFIDEIDKIAGGRSGKSGPDVSREGVQRDLLPIVEGSSVTTKYGVIQTDHVLFIAAGAFHFSKPSDMIPELQGRFPIRVELNNLTKGDFLKILKEPKNALTKQYIALIEAENVSIEFSDDALEEIAEKAFAINEEMENIGARRLQTIMSKLLNDILFDIPDTIGAHSKILINKALVDEKLTGIIKNKDLSEYIL